MMLSDVCLSIAYIGPKLRTERPRKTKIDIDVAHITRDSDTTFKVKRSKVKVTGGGGILWRPPAQLVDVCDQYGGKWDIVFNPSDTTFGGPNPAACAIHISGNSISWLIKSNISEYTFLVIQG